MRTLRDDATIINLKNANETRRAHDDRKLSVGERFGIILAVGCIGWGLVAAIAYGVAALIGL